MHQDEPGIGPWVSSDDAGFSLIETVMAAVVLALSAVIVAGLLVNTLSQVKSTGQRSTAVDIASSRLERVRQVVATAIPDGRSTDTQTVGNTTYTIVQTATYVTTANATGSASGCSAGGRLAYKRVNIRVTWPRMGSVAPVTSETLRALGFSSSSGGLDASKGAIGVQVLDSDGKPLDNAKVTLTYSGGNQVGTQTTGSDGCAVFTGVTAGATVYSSATSPGYISVLGADTATDSGSGTSASAGVLGVVSLQMGVSSALAYTLSKPAGALNPVTELTPALTWSGWPSGQTDRQPVAGCTGANTLCLDTGKSTVRRLTPGAYGAWLGCADARPASPTKVPVGATATTTVALPTSAVVVSTTTAAAVGQPVYAVHAADSLCTAQQTIQLGVVPAIGSTATFALPAGTWTVRRGSLAGSSATFTVGTSQAVSVS